MPAKGSILLYGDRDYIFNTEFYKENLVKEKDVKLSYKEAKSVIDHANLLIADLIRDDVEGFKLPFGFGYLAPVSYVATKPAINWDLTKKLGKKVYHTNMHTNGESCKISWFRVGRVNNTHYNEVFKFKAYKTLSNKISTSFKNGKPYVNWSVNDFLEKGRLENLYNKKYRKELKQ